MVMSGNSPRRWARTSPMLMSTGPRAGEELAAAAPENVTVRSGALVRTRSRDEDEPELPDLYLVAAGERRRLDPLPVDVGAVEAADVAHGEGAALAVELGVPAGDRHVVEEDVAVRMPTAGGHVVVEQEARARVGTPPHHQQRHPRR